MNNQEQVIEKEQVFVLSADFTWSSVPLSLPAMAHAASLVHDGKWYISGGINSQLQAMSDLFIVDLETMQVELHLPCSELPARFGHSLVHTGTSLYLIGGMADYQNVGIVYPQVYKLEQAQWVLQNDTFDNVCWNSYARAVYDNGAICLYGGKSSTKWIGHENRLHYLHTMPVELQDYVLQYCTLETLNALALVNKSWHALATSMCNT